MLFNFKNNSKNKESTEKEEENAEQSDETQMQQALKNLSLIQMVDLISQSIDQTSQNLSQEQNKNGKTLLDTLKSKAEQLVKEKQQLEERISELQQQIKDQRIEHLASQKNTIMQNEDEMKKARLFANAQLIESTIIELIDNISECKKILDQLKDDDENIIPIVEACKSLQMSIDNTHEKLLEYNLYYIKPEVDSKYDPNEHQIISNINEKQNENNASMPIQRILSVLQPGYKIEQEDNKRVIRAAKVTIITRED